MNRYRNCMKIIRKFAVVQKFEWRDSRDKYELVTNVEAARDGTVSSAPRQHCVAFGNVAAPQRGGREADLCTGQGGRGRWVQPRPQKDFQVGGPCQPWILAEVPGSLKPQVPSILYIPNMEGHRNEILFHELSDITNIFSVSKSQRSVSWQIFSHYPYLPWYFQPCHVWLRHPEATRRCILQRRQATPPWFSSWSLQGPRWKRLTGTAVASAAVVLVSALDPLKA